jgi:hypothetical protein
MSETGSGERAEGAAMGEHDRRMESRPAKHRERPLGVGER